MKDVPSTPYVVLVVHPGSELYGSDRMMAESVSALVEAGLRVHVALPDAGPLMREVEARGASAEVVEMPVLRKSGLRPKGAAALAWTALRSAAPTFRLLRRVRPDVVYVSTQILPSWLVAGRLVGARTVVHVHEAETHPSRLVTAGLTAPLALAHRLLLNSRYAAEVLSAQRPSLTDRMTVVYNGVVGPDQPSSPRERIVAPLRLAYIGRLSPRKGPDVAIEAARVLRARGVAATLSLTGSAFSGYEWFERQLRDQAAELVADDSVTFRGFRDAVWPDLAEADIVLVPSTAPEPFGNIAVEAMLAARPVVAARSGGLPEALDGARAARLVDPGDPVALADAVESLTADWSLVSAAAWTDAGRARARFAPGRYRRELVDAVLGCCCSGDAQMAQRYAAVG